MATSVYGETSVRRETVRGNAPNYDPINERADILADLLWERARRIADVLAPEVPYDQEPMDDEDVWLLLETVALNLSPAVWDNPNAIEDLIRLRKKFAPQLIRPELTEIAKYRRKTERLIPDPKVTPQSEEFAKMMRRIAA